MSCTPSDVMEDLYALAARGEDQRVVETVVRVFEERLRGGDFAFVDATLRAADAERLAPSALLSALSITFAAKDQLVERSAFVQRVEVVLRVQVGEERAARLLESRR